MNLKIDKLFYLIDLFYKKASWADRAPDDVKDKIKQEMSDGVERQVFIVWPNKKGLNVIDPQEIIAEDKDSAIMFFNEKYPDITIGDVEYMGTLKDVLIENGWTDINDAKKKKRDLTPAAKGMMKGKKHPWQACMNKMKDKMESPEAFCAKLKDLHTGTTEWRSTDGLKNKK